MNYLFVVAIMLVYFRAIEVFHTRNPDVHVKSDVMVLRFDFVAPYLNIFDEFIIRLTVCMSEETVENDCIFIWKLPQIHIVIMTHHGTMIVINVAHLHCNSVPALRVH